jgi:hypothetical protein
MKEIDIWRTAKVLVDAHGDQAEFEATMRADHALSESNLDALRVWKRVVKAVQALQRHEPGPLDNVN